MRMSLSSQHLDRRVCIFLGLQTASVVAELCIRVVQRVVSQPNTEPTSHLHRRNQVRLGL